MFGEIWWELVATCEVKGLYWGRALLECCGRRLEVETTRL